MDRLNLRRIEEMTIHDMEFEISYSIDNMRLTSRHTIDDIIRLLKAKRGLLLVDPSQASKKAHNDFSQWAAKEMKRLQDEHLLMCKEFLDEVSMWEHLEEGSVDDDKSPTSKTAVNGISPAAENIRPLQELRQLDIKVQVSNFLNNK